MNLSTITQLGSKKARIQAADSSTCVFNHHHYSQHLLEETGRMKCRNVK